MFKFKQVYTNQITSRLPGETSFDIIDMPFFTSKHMRVPKFCGQV
jgi:hypothetical protein